MSLRLRFALATALAVALVVGILTVGVYRVTENVLYQQVDDDLRERAGEAELRPTPDGLAVRLPTRPFGSGTRSQVVSASPDDDIGGPGHGRYAIPVTERDREIAGGVVPAGFRTAQIEGESVRVFVQQLTPGYAVLLARPLNEVESSLERLRAILLVVAALGIGAAAVLGLFAARSALRPVRNLTRTAEEIAETADVTRRIDVSGTDELSRLATTLNEMLTSLEASQSAQRNLVADASHELRTPLTSIRTNVELLARPDGISPQERSTMVSDIVVQLEELTQLVGDLIDLAREPGEHEVVEDVRLDLLVEDAVARVGRRSPSARFTVSTAPTLVQGDPARLDRAVVNLLENAVTWSPPDQPIEVGVGDGTVVVRDHGPGFEADEAERLFDRFYRSARARGHPGSGLGLAIVKRVAESHGGAATAERAEGGGALFTLSLPPEPLSEAS